MSSQIAPNAIDTAFPKKYSDNDSQAFRDNFNLIKSNFQIAKDEITNLQLTPPLTTDSIAALRSTPLSGVTSGTAIQVLGYSAPGDGGGGLMYWQDPSAAIDNNATVVGSVDSVTGHWVRPSIECVNLKWFGAAGDKVTDDSTAVQAAISFAIANQVALYVPAGTYILGPAVHSITATLTAALPSFSMFGDGAEVSIFKESDDRVTTSGYTDCKMLYITTTEAADSVTISGIRFDKNGSSTTPLAPGSSENKSSHSISVSIKTSGFLNSLVLDNLRFADKLGAHVHLTSGQIDTAYIKNCQFGEFIYTGEEVGDIECKATIRQFIIDESDGQLIQVAPTDVAALNANRTTIVMSTCQFADVDLVGFSELASDMTVIVDTCQIPSFSASTLELRANNSILGMSNRPWAQLVSKSTISASTLIITADALNNTIPWDINPDFIDFDCHLTVSNCSIMGDDSFNSSIAGYAISSSGWFSGVTEFEVVFDSCKFDPRFSKVIDATSTGNFKFVRCSLAGIDAFAQVGSAEHLSDITYGSLEIVDCDMTNVGALLLEFNLDVDSPAYVNIHGNHPYSNWKFSNVGDLAAAARIPATVNFSGVWQATATPTGPGIVSQVVSITNAELGDPCEYIATTTDQTTASWVVKSRAIAGVTQAELVAAITALDIPGIHGDITSEENARIAADGILQGNINGLGSSLSGDLVIEANARSAADGILQGNIGAVAADLVIEANARGVADGVLQDTIGDVADDLSALALVVSSLPVSTITEELIADYASTTNIAIDIGTTPNTYVLASQALLFEAPSVLQTGTQVRFKAGITNTGASTLDYLGSTATPLLRNDGTNLQAGDLSTTSYNLVSYVTNGLSSTWRLQSAVSASTTSPGVVQFATNVETAAGISNKAVTPAGFLSQFSTLLALNNGHQTFPGGFTIKWGVATVPADSDVTISFSPPFPVACVGVTVSEILDNVGLVNYVRLKSAPTTSTAVIQNANSSPQVAYWVAFGY